MIQSVANTYRVERDRQAVITGLGVISPIGSGRRPFAEALYAGRSGIDFITLFDASSYPTRFAGEVRDFDAGRLLAGARVQQSMRERRILFAVAAARLAVEDAALHPALLREQRTAVVLGAGVHPVVPDPKLVMASGMYDAMFHDPSPDHEKFSKTVSADGEHSRYPICNRVNGGALAVAYEYGLAGICQTIVSACAAATQAIGAAATMIHRGDADIALCGGYDSMIFNFGVYAFCLLGLMSTQNDNPATAMKPFDKRRDGFALGEGAGVLVLESAAHARKRGAKVYARIAGYGASIDAYKVTDPHPEGTGAVIAMRQALQDAGMQPDEIQYINAHGTATPKNDKIETRAIKEVFGTAAYHIPVSSTKSMIGHLMAAGGALELIACVLGIEHGFLPPTINYETPDPDCDLDYVPNRARDCAVRTALSNSFGLGGQNASLIVCKD
ncbi:MAG: beta-ketoacyl-[acyl-carrier-protein] synthase II [Desulfobacterota bacterium]|nr:beta-ketoacyl-[acyl-carrier-protein] synthase II [Thermodesulfobacteriota bacterium]